MVQQGIFSTSHGDAHHALLAILCCWALFVSSLVANARLLGLHDVGKPDPKDAAATARWLAAHNSWGVLRSYPFSGSHQILSFFELMSLCGFCCFLVWQCRSFLDYVVVVFGELDYFGTFFFCYITTYFKAFFSGEDHPSVALVVSFCSFWKKSNLCVDSVVSESDNDEAFEIMWWWLLVNLVALITLTLISCYIPA